MIAGELFTTNDSEFSSEVIDREVIIINFNTGSYYSLRGVAASIWGWMQNPVSCSQLVGAVKNTYSDPGLGCENEIEAFLLQLSEEGLIIPAPEDKSPGVLSDATTSDEQGARYTTPVLEMYTDMQELIVLDAIQE